MKTKNGDSMYAIVEIGNKQYKISKNDEILAEKAVSTRTHKLLLDKVLMSVKDKNVKIGNPYLKNIKVDCEIIAHLKGRKTIAYKYRRRKSSQSKRGHRQKLLLLKVKDIRES